MAFVGITEGHYSSAYASVRWFEEAPQTATTELLCMSRLRWCKHEQRVGGGPTSRMDFLDLVPVQHIIEPVFVQRDPTSVGYFFYNHFVR